MFSHLVLYNLTLYQPSNCVTSNSYFQLPVKKKPISPVVTTQNIKTDTTVQSSVMQPTTNNDSMANPAAGPIGKIRSIFSNGFIRN